MASPDVLSRSEDVLSGGKDVCGKRAREESAESVSFVVADEHDCKALPGRLVLISRCCALHAHLCCPSSSQECRCCPALPRDIELQSCIPAADPPRSPRSLVVGRGQQLAQLVLDSARYPKMLSRRHATLTWDEAAEAWLLEDLGTQNGTSVNGNRLSGGAHALEEGDIVCFGHASGSTPSEVTYRFVASCAPRDRCESSEY